MCSISKRNFFQVDFLSRYQKASQLQEYNNIYVLSFLPIL